MILAGNPLQKSSQLITGVYMMHKRFYRQRGVRVALWFILLPLLASMLLNVDEGWLSPSPTALHAQETPFLVPDGFMVETVASGLQLPTSFAFAGPNRIFVTEKSGAVRVIVNNELLAEPFIDLSSEVNDVGQRGLLGIAVHPNFPTTPYLYLAYVYDPPEASGHNAEGARVSRLLRISANSANLNQHLPGSGLVILGKNSLFTNIGDPDRPEKNPLSCESSEGVYLQDCLPNEGAVHALAHLAFGRDGALYVGSGDGLNYNYGSLRAQSLDTLVGKVLRINPITGDGYATNPFYDGDPQSNRSKVYLYGMKHPYRFAFHPTSGELFLGDVGNLKWEEVNRARAGANLGWPCFEGENPNAFDPVCKPLLAAPSRVTFGFHTYAHDDGWGAVIGGDFYTGRAFPAYYRGAYFYGDFNKGTVQSVVFNRAGVPTFADFATGIPGLVQISNGPDGALYFLSVVKGNLYRVRYTGDTKDFLPSSSATDGASNARATVTPTPRPTVRATTLDGEGAVDADSEAAVVTETEAATEVETKVETEATAEADAESDSDSGSSDQASQTNTHEGNGSGQILREWWSGIGGKGVSDLTESSQYKGKPTGSELIGALDAPRLVGPDYGTRIRGYLHPPVSGSYRFWIAADDSGELWLSTDANPANKQRIASAPQWTHAEVWDKYGSQQSMSVTLQTGQRYYIEVLHKQADQKDNLTVAWQIPGAERAVISGAYLSPPE